MEVSETKGGARIAPSGHGKLTEHRPRRPPRSEPALSRAVRGEQPPVGDPQGGSTGSRDDAHEYWFLAQAYIAASAYGKALEFVEAGLACVPGDRALIATRRELIATRGDARSGLRDDEGASADWQLALELRRDEGHQSARPR